MSGVFRFENTQGCSVVVVLLKKAVKSERVTGSRWREARAGVIWSRYHFPGRRRHNLCFQTTAGGKAKIDQQQNTGNYSNPDHEQQTCGSLSSIGSEAGGSLTPPASLKRHLMRKTQSAFPMRSWIQLERKSRYYIILKTFSSLCPILPRLDESEALIACAVQSANWRLLYILVLMTIEAFRNF